MLNRRSIQVSLPEFVYLALEHLAAEANGESETPDKIDINDVIEWHLVETITVRDVALLEREHPGFAAAVSTWLSTAIFES